MPYGEALCAPRSDPERYMAMARSSIADHVPGDARPHAEGAVTFDYGNNIRGEAVSGGRRRCVRYPGVCPGVHTAALLRRQGALPLGRAFRGSGGHLQDRPRGHGEFPENEPLCRWIGKAQKQVRFQGLPPGFAGSGTASVRRWGRYSTTSSRGVKCAHRSSSGGITLTAAPWPPQPGDGEDEGRERRHRRLADTERPAECRAAARAG